MPHGHKGQSATGKQNVDQISKRLEEMRTFFPCDFVRKSRGLKEVKKWKATEFRNFLLYSGPVVLDRILPKVLYDHFIKFHVAIKILVHPDLCVSLNEYAGRLLLDFASAAQKLYGDQFCSHNVHNLIHLHTEVANHGPLDFFSSFPFENHLQFVKGLVRKNDKPLQQVVRRIAEINKNQLPKYEPQVQAIICWREHNTGPTLTNCRGTQFEEIRLKNYRLQRSKPNNGVILNKGTVVFIRNIIENGNGCFIIGNSFNQTNHLFEKPLKSGILNTFSVSSLKVGKKSNFFFT